MEMMAAMQKKKIGRAHVERENLESQVISAIVAGDVLGCAVAFRCSMNGGQCQSEKRTNRQDAKEMNSWRLGG
jgi:hypothetical protein